MAETIPGGAYKSADGTWRDAKGKELSSRQIEAFMELKEEQAAERAQAEASTLPEVPESPKPRTSRGTQSPRANKPKAPEGPKE